MSDDVGQDQHLHSRGRVLYVTACGDTPDEIEMAALDEARAFFGPDLRLVVIRDWQASQISPRSIYAQTGKKYTADVRVRTVEDSGP